MSEGGRRGPDDCRRTCSLRQFVAAGFNLPEAIGSVMSIVSDIAELLSGTGLISDEERSELEQLKKELQDHEKINSTPNRMIEIANKLHELWVRSILEQNKRLEEKKRRLEQQEKELGEHREEIERRGRDALTGLLNRHDLRGLLEGLQRDGEVFSIAMLDIDFFKKINDEYGHDMGDRVLITLAERLIEKFGKNLCVRMGGEEVLIAFKGSAIALFGELESFKAYFSGIKIPDRRNPLVKVSATFSAGIAEYNGWGIDDLIETADSNLYHAKNTGKNRIVIERPQGD